MFYGAIVAPALAQTPDDFTWTARATSWTSTDEANFEQFVAAIAQTDCATVVECFGPAANPLAQGDPPGLTFSADCADLVYMLRAYFAWKKGLPFGFLSEIAGRNGYTGDLRYSPGGNKPVQRWDVSADPQRPDIRAVFQAIRDTVSTATFRVDPRIDRPVAQDFYSPAITREALRPGSAIYNGDGHVVILARIDRSGRIHFMDAHPDGSVTRGVYAGQFATGDPATGAGFHAWRPIRQQDGALTLAANAQIASFSMEQYLGPGQAADWRKADFAQGGLNHDYVEFTRRRLAKGRLIYDVVEEARVGFAGLCDAVAERERYVDEAVERGLPAAPRPGRLDGASAEERATWFAHSTPGRDRRFRKQVAQVDAMLARFIALYSNGDRSVRFRGRSLKQALARAFARTAGRCTIDYRNTDHDPVSLSLRQILQRLPDLSFDPYHCPERRWGASGAELARCDEDGIKARWYAAEAALRRIERYQAPDNPTLQELEAATSTYRPAGQLIDIEATIDKAPDRRRRRAR